MSSPPGRPARGNRSGAPWRVQISKGALKVLGRLPRDLRQRIDRQIRSLSEDPRPSGCVMLKGEDHQFYRIKVGGFRIIYAFREEELVILVIEIGPRGDVYRDL